MQDLKYNPVCPICRQSTMTDKGCSLGCGNTFIHSHDENETEDGIDMIYIPFDPMIHDENAKTYSREELQSFDMAGYNIIIRDNASDEEELHQEHVQEMYADLAQEERDPKPSRLSPEEELDALMDCLINGLISDEAFYIRKAEIVKKIKNRE